MGGREVPSRPGIDRDRRGKRCEREAARHADAERRAEIEREHHAIGVESGREKTGKTMSLQQLEPGSRRRAEDRNDAGMRGRRYTDLDSVGLAERDLLPTRCPEADVEQQRRIGRNRRVQAHRTSVEGQLACTTKQKWNVRFAEGNRRHVSPVPVPVRMSDCYNALWAGIAQICGSRNAARGSCRSHTNHWLGV